MSRAHSPPEEFDVIFEGISTWSAVLLAGVTAAALAGLHLLRFRREPLVVITTIFWRDAARYSQARTLLDRFRGILSYLLLLLISLLLITALVMPQWGGDSQEKSSLVIVLDAGLSMGAVTESGKSRLDTAVQYVEQAILPSRPGNEALAVIVADPLPRVVHQLGDPHCLVTSRLAKVRTAYSAGLVNEAVQMAHTILNGQFHKHIVVVTDRTEALEIAAADEDNTSVVSVGQPVANNALLSAMFYPYEHDPVSGQFMVRIGSWAASPQTETVRIETKQGQTIANQSVTITPGEPAVVSVPNIAANGAELVVYLTGKDAVASDNRIIFRLPRRLRIKTILSEDISGPLLTALKAETGLELVSPESPGDLFVGYELPSSPTPAALLVSSVSLPKEYYSNTTARWASDLAEELCLQAKTCDSATDWSLQTRSNCVEIVENETVLASFATIQNIRTALLSSTFVNIQSSWTRHPIFPVMIHRITCVLAGWDDMPLVVPSKRWLGDPVWVKKQAGTSPAISVPGSRSASNLWKESALNIEYQLPPSSGQSALLAPYELLLVLALILTLIQISLYRQGRIA